MSSSDETSFTLWTWGSVFFLLIMGGALFAIFDHPIRVAGGIIAAGIIAAIFVFLIAGTIEREWQTKLRIADWRFGREKSTYNRRLLAGEVFHWEELCNLDKPEKRVSLQSYLSDPDPVVAGYAIMQRFQRYSSYSSAHQDNDQFKRTTKDALVAAVQYFRLSELDTKDHLTLTKFFCGLLQDEDVLETGPLPAWVGKTILCDDNINRNYGAQLRVIDKFGDQEAKQYILQALEEYVTQNKHQHLFDLEWSQILSMLSRMMDTWNHHVSENPVSNAQLDAIIKLPSSFNSWAHYEPDSYRVISVGYDAMKKKAERLLRDRLRKRQTDS